MKFFEHYLYAPIRRLVTSSIYGLSCILFVTNLSLTYNTFSTTDLILVSLGTSFWGLATIHSILRNIYLLHAAIKEKVPDNTNCIERSSTHAIYSCVNHVISSSLFFAVDAYKLNQATPAMICRITGTTLWFKSSVLGLCLGIGDAVKPVQSNNRLEIARLVCELDILAAGILYTYPVWSQGYPLKDTYHVCWLLASLIESSNAIFTMLQKDKVENTAPATLKHEPTLRIM